MKRINSYTNKTSPEEVKNYFNDKINWKVIRFIDSCMIEHEDGGIIFDIKISLRNGDDVFGIYDFRDKSWVKYSRWRTMSEFKNAYENVKKLNYDVSIISNTTPKEDIPALTKIGEQIKNKFGCDCVVTEFKLIFSI